MHSMAIAVWLSACMLGLAQAACHPGTGNGVLKYRGQDHLIVNGYLIERWYANDKSNCTEYMREVAQGTTTLDVTYDIGKMQEIDEVVNYSDNLAVTRMDSFPLASLKTAFALGARGDNVTILWYDSRQDLTALLRDDDRTAIAVYAVPDIQAQIDEAIRDFELSLAISKVQQAHAQQVFEG